MLPKFVVSSQLSLAILIVSVLFSAGAEGCTNDTDCQNGGKCLDNAANPPVKVCFCSGDFTGDNCQIDPRCVNFCDNDGECSITDEKPTCNCSATKFTGTTCEINNACNGTCKHDGRCEMTKGDTPEPVCYCAAGYMGDTCEDSTKCHQFCNNGGNCSLGEDDKPTCDCTAPYTGETCDDVICKKECAKGSECVMTGTGDEREPACLCADGYTGETCNISTACLGYCQNGGNCTSDNDKPSCKCPAQFTGDTCESVICEKECKNDGQCFMTGAKTACLCTDGFTGDACEKEVPKSESHSGQSFDAASFIGGIVLAVGVIILAVVGWKIYSRKKAPTSQYSNF